MRKVRVLRGSLSRFDWEFVVGPWMGRLALGPGSFGWSPNPIRRWIMRYWSGWHRWDQEQDW